MQKTPALFVTGVIPRPVIGTGGLYEPPGFRLKGDLSGSPLVLSRGRYMRIRHYDGRRRGMRKVKGGG
jgi:hypothetical protein